MENQPKDPRAESLRVRLPKDLRAHLHQMAEDQGITTNTLLVVLLAEASGWQLRPVEDKPDSPTEQP